MKFKLYCSDDWKERQLKDYFRILVNKKRNGNMRFISNSEVEKIISDNLVNDNKIETLQLLIEKVKNGEKY